MNRLNSLFRIFLFLAIVAGELLIPVGVSADPPGMTLDLIPGDYYQGTQSIEFSINGFGGYVQVYLETHIGNAWIREQPARIGVQVNKNPFSASFPISDLDLGEYRLYAKATVTIYHVEHLVGFATSSTFQIVPPI